MSDTLVLAVGGRPQPFSMTTFPQRLLGWPHDTVPDFAWSRRSKMNEAELQRSL